MSVLKTTFVAVMVMTIPLLGDTNSCSNILPSSLDAALRAKFPEMRLVTSEMLLAEDREKFRKDHPGLCPGAARADFYGDGRDSFAILLISGEETEKRLRLVVSRQKGDGWTLSVIESMARKFPPVVWSAPPGRYTSFYGDKTITSRHPVFVLVGYDAFAIAYSWTGSTVEKVWLKD